MADVHLGPSTWQQPVPEPASPGRTALLTDLAARIHALRPGRLKVAVDGLSAAGKTSFGHELAHHLTRHGRDVHRAALDDFKQPWRDRHLYDRFTGEGYYRNAYDLAAVRELLLGPFTRGEPVALTSIDPLTQVDHRAVTTTTTDTAVLLLDGMFAFRPELDDHWDFRIWLEVTPETSLERARRRDGDDELHRHRYLPAARLYLAEVDPVRRADVIIDNTAYERPELGSRP
ncbi:uridine kinase [Actinosynnema sp. NPDC020468]|uniref:uridine kinase n=1 Tax=Actinosynnema sp. NPDC020468 TaxID=3154488 RepID=UPI003406A8E6